MPIKWSIDLSQEFWQRRQIHVITRDDDRNDRWLALCESQALRQQEDRLNRATFQTTFANQLANTTSPPFVGLRVADCLKFWIQLQSWTYCDQCYALKNEKLFPRYRDRQQQKTTKSCHCRARRHHIPRAQEIPDSLRLSDTEVRAVRPFTIHCGDYRRAQHGYRQKTNIFRVQWSVQSPTEKNVLPDESSRQRCYNAHEYLINFPQSSYRSSVERRAAAVANNSFNMYKMADAAGLECALWPNLYPTRLWCESIIEGSGSRLSTNIAHMSKVFSEVADYGLSFELLQYHYDMWIFKTVSGAIASARRLQCSPAKSLETKSFSSGYWKWEHRCLLDAVRQFSFPTVFLTLSPYEWTFPVTPWLAELRRITRHGPTGLAAFETNHITHELEQIIRGYLCGSNDSRWTSHLFGNERHPNVCNIQTYLYRFEFQQRGTAHVNLMVWLNSVESMRTNLVRADIPWCNSDMAYAVHKLQKCDRTALVVNNCPTAVAKVNDREVLQLHHPADAFACNLRAYVCSLIPTLECRMDFQTTDGRGMLLRYVTSYVSKWHDAYSNDALYSIHVSPFEAAYRHLKQMKPLEPEMWMSPRKVAWTSTRRKKFAVPTSENYADNTVYQKYRVRGPAAEELSLLEWLRAYDHTKNPPAKYKQGVTLVGLKLRSPLHDEYFLQEMIVHEAHRNTADYCHGNHNDLPPQISFFASAVSRLPTKWESNARVETHSREEGHPEFFIATVVAHIPGLRDFHVLWQRQVLSRLPLPLQWFPAVCFITSSQTSTKLLCDQS